MADQGKFVAGDVVVLKSGGPAMTVAAVNDDASLTCDWFNGDPRADKTFAQGEFKENYFRPEAVKKLGD